MANKNLKYLFRFSIVGVVNTSVDFLIFFTLISWFTTPQIIAHITAFSGAVLVGFLLNKSWAFKGGLQQRRTYLFPQFLAICLCALIASSLVLLLLAQVMPVLMAKVGATSASFSINFIGSRYIFLKRTS